MYKNLTLLCLAVSLAACSPEENTQQSEKAFTHQVCTFDPENNDEIKARVDIDETVDWLLLESLTQAAGDVVEHLEDDDITGAFASATFLVPSFADMFSGFYIFYMCTEASYEFDQCNWEIVDEEANEILRVQTTVGANLKYTATASKGNDQEMETILVIDGIVGDLGNLTINIYENGLVDLTRVTTRSPTGFETVEYTSEDSHWIASESSECAGSLDFESTDSEGRITTLDSSWTFGGGHTSGSLDYFKTGNEGRYLSNW
jgi:hypothetical protein